MYVCMYYSIYVVHTPVLFEVPYTVRLLAPPNISCDLHVLHHLTTNNMLSFKYHSLFLSHSLTQL